MLSFDKYNQTMLVVGYEDGLIELFSAKDLKLDLDIEFQK